MILTSATLSATTQAAQSAQPGQAKAPAAAQDAQAPAASATAAAPAPGNAAQAAAQPFAQWLGQETGDAALALQAFLPAAGAAAVPAPAVGDTAAAVPADATATAAATPAPAANDGAADDTTVPAAAPDTSLLAAMAMPLMPLSPQQVTQAVQAAQGGTRAGSTDAGTGDAPARQAVQSLTQPLTQSLTQPAAQPLAAAGQDARRAAAALPQALLAQIPGQQAYAQPASAQQAAHADATAASVHQDVQAAAAGGNTAAAASQDAGTDAQPVQAGTTPAAAPVMGAVAAAPAQPAADTVKLAGPPTAWRQTLQETLGDRLHVQVGNNVQQATISIEPPQLGRIDIAIRHSAGTLEVNISATNGEVLRQLQTVGDNLRSDLSQRQYTEVAVTVTPTPKNGAAPFGDPQQQGRGRQQDREQDNEPGRGLAEAGNPASVFKLGRDS